MREANGQLARFGWKIITDWSFSLSALIAYYLLISLLPLILSMFAVVSMIFGDNGKFQNQIRDRLVKAFPEQGLSDVLDALLTSLSKQAGLVFIVSFIVALFTGSRLFVGLDDVLTIIYRIRERKIIEQNLLAIKMIVAFVAIMPFIIIFSSIPAIMERQESVYQFITIVLGGLCAFAFFQLTYLILPKRRMNWNNTSVEISSATLFSNSFLSRWCGALFGAVCLQFLLLLFPLYVHEFMADYVGQLGFIIITLLLFYAFGLIFVLGAQINAFFFDRIQALPTGLGTCLSEFSDREQVHLMDDNSQSMKTDLQEFHPSEAQP